MTRRELKEHCMQQYYCVDCEYYPALCFIEYDGEVVAPYQYPEAILDTDVPTRYKPSIIEGLLVAATLGTIGGALVISIAHGVTALLELLAK